MRNLLMVLLIMICAWRAFSQANVYHPFPLSEKTEWRSDYFSIDCIDQNYSLCSSWKNYTKGDSIVNSLTYIKIYQDGINYNSDTQYVYYNYFSGLLREDTANKKIYYIDSGNPIEQLLYDFNLEVGDTSTTLFYPGAIVASIDSMLIGNQYHKRINFENAFPLSSYIVEGVGTMGGLFTVFNGYYGFEGAEVLKCFRVNDTVLYEDSSYIFTSCELSFPTFVEEVENYGLYIFPNPAFLNQSLIIREDLYPDCTYSIYNSMGKAVYLNQPYNNFTGISLTKDLFSPGIYLLRIYYDKSLFETKKIIIQ